MKRPFQSQPTPLVTTESLRWESRRLQEQTNSTLVLLLTQASSTLSSFPQQRGLALPGGLRGNRGMSLLPPRTHIHTALRTGEQRASGKHSLALSCFLYAATLHTAPGRILPPLLLLKLLQHVVLLLYTAACF